jgi:two-component system, OmpR family, KDP operon response regulator KdpE
MERDFKTARHASLLQWRGVRGAVRLCRLLSIQGLIMNHLLIVDDDGDFRETLMKTLKSRGYRATGISSPVSLGSAVAVNRPNVILLDMLFEDGSNGVDTCRQLRAWSSLPVVILSVLDDEDTKVQALDAGADDYLVKPFGVNELLARIRAVERRVSSRDWKDTPVLTLGDLTINFEKHLVTVGGKPVRLTRKENALLKTLAHAEGRLVPYDKIMDSVWPGAQEPDRGRVRALVMYLRGKLQEDLSSPKYILTEAGVGYRLNL